jgi:hypothetical protein
MVAWGIERLISDAYERDPAGWQNLTSINIRRVKNPASAITNNVGGDEQCRSGGRMLLISFCGAKRLGDQGVHPGSQPQ